MAKKKKQEIVPAISGIQFPEVLTERQGVFKQGRDKLGRPYIKKQDTNGLYSKIEILKDGTQKVTLKKKP
ncbi:MAG: hypothetical protein Q4F05_19920 [bacterium]|nr:hypothetical protein [bacterium]